MFKKIILVFILFLSVFLFSAGNSIVEAKDYSFPSIKITVNINENGSFDFTEERTYRFDGSFSWADYNLKKEGSRSITGFTVSEGSKVYVDSDIAVQPQGSLSMGSSSIYAKWDYGARDEERTFTIKYHVIGGIKSYSDVAEFNWKFIGKEWDKRIGDLEVLVNLPPGASKDEIAAWAHGPLYGNVEILSPQQVRYTISNLPPKTFVEGRIAFPPSLLGTISTQDKYLESRLETILTEETKWANEANQQRMLFRFLIGLSVFSMILGWGFWYFLWKKHGEEYETHFEGDYFRELPADYSPALVGYLMSFGNVDS
ncbi:MAG: DUF2207 domain-containing protein [Actinomycetia bacterium]|nr:DUF2207 domain-containing protein [Actinomycetes bacterium]